MIIKTVVMRGIRQWKIRLRKVVMFMVSPNFDPIEYQAIQSQRLVKGAGSYCAMAPTFNSDIFAEKLQHKNLTPS
jgi:hypothetical protein